MVRLQRIFWCTRDRRDEKDYYGKLGSIGAPRVIAELWPGPPGAATQGTELPSTTSPTSIAPRAATRRPSRSTSEHSKSGRRHAAPKSLQRTTTASPWFTRPSGRYAAAELLRAALTIAKALGTRPPRRRHRPRQPRRDRVRRAHFGGAAAYWRRATDVSKHCVERLRRP
jgi:hypothetical protein